MFQKLAVFAAMCRLPLEQKKPVLQKSIGLALTPQAGVAMGMALLAAEKYPTVGPAVITITAASTIVFEIGGPILTRKILERDNKQRRQHQI